LYIETTKNTSAATKTSVITSAIAYHPEQGCGQTSIRNLAMGSGEGKA
jgi:hypothetical protein